MTHIVSFNIALPTTRSIENYTTNLSSSNLLFLSLENQSVATGGGITFTVEATEDHDLQFQWQKDGKDIDSDESQFPPSRTGHSSTLQIQFVGKSDKGHYKCLVKSPLEKSRKSLHSSGLEVGKFIVI